jgi:hypothetical protein
VEPSPLSWSRRHCRGAAAIFVEPPPLCLATTATMEPPPLLWSRRRCRRAVTIVVIDMPLPSLLSCRRCHGAAIVIVEPSLLSWSRFHCKTKKKKTKTKKKTKKTKKKKKNQSLRSHYNMLNEFATSAQSS